MQHRALNLLANWAKHSETHWYAIPGRPDLGCYGTGYNSWGVQTNQKYLSAMATFAARGAEIAGLDCDWARERALAALRFSLDSHLSGAGRCTDGTQWGHTWISSLGVERMMHGVHLLSPHFNDSDRDALRRMLTSEADWLFLHCRRGNADGVVADRWNHSGKNVPESNLWNGALLWRAAVMYPDHPHAADWQERAHVFLINSVSVAGDATDETVVAGKPVRERHVGANFFPNYALDHHGYFNVGYMVICVSNAAMLHFDLKLQGLPRPESLDHHEADLWQVLRRLVFDDGRLARLGGDSRTRYAYCQEYLLPSLMYAADRFGDAHALGLAEGQLGLIEKEAAYAADGSFYGRRLAEMAAQNPYYYTRLESDRACVLGMLVAYRPVVCAPEFVQAPRRHGPCARGATITIEGDDDRPPLSQSSPHRDKLGGGGIQKMGFDASVAGGWCEPEHGNVMHRSAKRLASFAWRAFGIGQGMCQPPSDSHLANWDGNLTGCVEFLSSPYPFGGAVAPSSRRFVDCRIDTFDGGFVTSGTINEGADAVFAEGWSGKDLAAHQIVFAALPDDRTVVGMELCRVGAKRCAVRSVLGLHLSLANDLYNGFRRTLQTATGRKVLRSPPREDAVVPLDSRWVSVDGKIGLIGLYGADMLTVRRSAERRRLGSGYRSLYLEEIGWSCSVGPRWVEPGQVLLDAGWAVLSGAGTRQTRAVAEAATTGQVELADPNLRGVSVPGADGRTYVVLVNFGTAPATVPVAALAGGGAGVTDLVGGVVVSRAGDLEILPGQARVVVRQG